MEYRYGGWVIKVGFRVVSLGMGLGKRVIVVLYVGIKYFIVLEFK